MRRVLFFAAIALLCLSCNKAGSPSDDGFSILTGEADDISYSYATVHGSIISSDGKPVNVEFGIQYSGNSQFMSDVTNLRARDFNKEDGSFIANIVDLKASTEYWYRAYLVNSEGQCVYGDIRSFRTSALQLNIITREASDVTSVSATLNGLYSNAGLSAEDIAGCSFFFLWGESENELSRKAPATVLPGNAFFAEIKGLHLDGKYWFKAACESGGKEFYGGIGSFETSVNDDDDVLIIMTEEAVDLGLTSGTKWCTHNLGGESMTDIGDFYAWADTTVEMHRDVNNPNLYYYYWQYTPYWIEGEGQTAKFSKYFTPNTDVYLEAEDDAASHIMGEGWRMPTEQDWRELLAECDWIWTTRYDNNGFIVRSKVNIEGKKNNIFLAAGGKYDEKGHQLKGVSGFYWSSYASYENKIYAYGLGFNTDDLMDYLYYGLRYEGLLVRPVLPSSNPE